MTTHERAVEVDTRLADLWGQMAAARDTEARATESLHSQDGQRRDPWARRQRWDVSDEETEASVRAKLADPGSSFYFSHPSVNGGEPYLDSRGKGAEATIVRLDTARAEQVHIAAEARPLQDEYGRDPWPRFYLVLNTNGHVHRSLNCATTFPTTQWAWLPDLSGLTEADAVASQGPRLCSVCYPEAPTEWTLGLPKAPRCPGSNLKPAPGRERYASQPCSVCGKSYPVGDRTGTVRAHKPAKEA